MIAGFAADEGDGLGRFKVGVDDAVKESGFVGFEWGFFVDLPEDFAGALVCWAADLLNERLYAWIADAFGKAIHSSLAFEFVSEVFYFKRLILEFEK